MKVSQFNYQNNIFSNNIKMFPNTLKSIYIDKSHMINYFTQFHHNAKIHLDDSDSYHEKSKMYYYGYYF